MERHSRQPDSPTIIGSQVKLNGNLIDSQDIIVNGQLTGELKSDKQVQIGESAEINGPVSADHIIVAGVVKGDIIAHSRLEITKSGRIFGSIVTKILSVEAGATLVGNCKMNEDGQGVKQSPDDSSIE
ncbi:MAG: hypothetical protein CEO22_340 [Candidatus Berkelbacteria bacterium Gr01-1014_85]|uniref:Integral membrane protein CcmA involved in cell shape determination n=1 Tax=Candidatus Berkelbacteria bacterium Gr01-1014_85 TaxID=2017150 RepID=A0A554JBZ1_9BACT|nr:MAG: hypothetical protein CEO22_340 [Candidatus Berkelbacteria bacterium Gr01-1014_85]